MVNVGGLLLRHAGTGGDELGFGLDYPALGKGISENHQQHDDNENRLEKSMHNIYLPTKFNISILSSADHKCNLRKSDLERAQQLFGNTFRYLDIVQNFHREAGTTLRNRA